MGAKIVRGCGEEELTRGRRGKERKSGRRKEREERKMLKTHKQSWRGAHWTQATETGTSETAPGQCTCAHATKHNVAEYSSSPKRRSPILPQQYCTVQFSPVCRPSIQRLGVSTTFQFTKATLPFAVHARTSLPARPAPPSGAPGEPICTAAGTPGGMSGEDPSSTPVTAPSKEEREKIIPRSCSSRRTPWAARCGGTS